MNLPFDQFNPRTLKAFEQRVAEAFNAGRIRAPVHLSGGNELKLLEYFRTQVREEDYVFTQWRSHYHCLLKGVDPERLFSDILGGRSITLCYPEHRILSSAIVGGHAPIALGVAFQLKREKDRSRVHCFMGDMTSFSGIVHECRTYARGHQLPISFVVEDNGISVCTPTSDTWGQGDPESNAVLDFGTTQYYKYELEWPHSGAGKRVEF